jgi:acetylornithine deacetylase/succinyl-diaminopimelate desuccinylase-like protein
MLGAISSQMRFPINSLVKLLGNPVLASVVLKRAPSQAKNLLTAFLTNTVTPTVLNAGVKTNVIPSSADAQLDCRLLPGQTPEDVIREITAITGEGLTMEPLATTSGTEFQTDSQFYRLLEKATRKMDPGGIIFPMLMPGATDANQYQRAGITVYGFTPGVLPPDFPTIKLGHGHDERYPISAIQSGLPVLWEVVSESCAA